MKPEISVVVPTYNRRPMLERLLQSLVEQTIAPDRYEVVVVSDGSTDDTHAFLEQFCQEHTTVCWFVQKNQGPAAARNLGIEKARTDLIAFTDDDCVVQSDWLEQILDAFAIHPQALGVEGKTISLTAEMTPLTHQIVSKNAGSFETCNIAYKKPILQQIGGFDTGYPYAAGEDVDLAYTVLKHGVIVFSDKVVVIHPPHQETLKGRLKRIWFHYWEFRLYDKHPEMYRQTRPEGTPFWTFIITLLLSYFYHEARQELHWLFRRPMLYLKFFAILIIERLFFVALLPIFFVRRVLGRWHKT